MNEYDYNDIDNWNIYKGVHIKKGSYNWWYYQVMFQVQRQRTFSPTITLSTGDFYTGTKNSLDVEVNLKTTPRYGLYAVTSYNDIEIENKTVQHTGIRRQV